MLCFSLLCSFGPPVAIRRHFAFSGSPLVATEATEAERPREMASVPHDDLSKEEKVRNVGCKKIGQNHRFFGGDYRKRLTEPQALLMVFVCGL